MDAHEVLLNSMEFGVIAAESPAEEKYFLDMVRIFKNALLAQVREDDTSGLMAGTYIYRNGKDLRGGLVLALGDRVVLGWMKGFLKKPMIEVVPYSTIQSAARSSTPRTKANRRVRSAIVIKAASEWELFCSPDVADEAPLYRILVELLSGKQTTSELPVLPEARG